MPDTDQIKPALTAEQWAAESHGDVARIVRDRGWSWLEVGRRASIADLGEIAAIRALANHLLPDDDPRKITRADVEAIEQGAATLAEETGFKHTERLGTLLHTAAKLAALLPPAE